MTTDRPNVIDGQFTVISDDSALPAPTPIHRETPRARQGYADYLAMGTSRSLDALLQMYLDRRRMDPKYRPPASRLSTIKLWSSAFHWQDRLTQLAIREAEAIARARQEALERETTTGIADQAERIARIKQIHAKAAKWVDGLSADVLEVRPRTAEVMTQIERGLLEDMAHEIGARRQHANITTTIIKRAIIQLTQQTGLSEEQLRAEANALAERMLEDGR